MAEDVQTGGLIKFRYGKGDSSPRLDEKRKRGIQDAYAQFHERKALEKRNKMIFWVLALIVLVILGFVAWKFIL